MTYSKQISAIKTNKEKQKLYQEQMKRYNKAMLNGFYFEALLIIYAVLEDRYRAFLYHSAIIVGRESIKLDFKKTETQIRSIVNEYADRGNDKKEKN